MQNLNKREVYEISLLFLPKALCHYEISFLTSPILEAFKTQSSQENVSK
jgi:hypothetical protein